MGCCLRGLAKIENRTKSHCEEGVIPPDANLAVLLAVLSAAALDRRPNLSLVRCTQRSVMGQSGLCMSLNDNEVLPHDSEKSGYNKF